MADTPEPKEIIMFYAETSARVRHLETTRHGLIALQVMAAGYFFKEVLSPGHEALLRPGFCALWMSITTLMLGVLAFVSHNLFIKILLCARLLMRTEYALRLAPRRLGYYSFGSTGQSLGFHVFGMLPSLIGGGYGIGMMFLTVPKDLLLGTTLMGLATAVFIYSCFHVYQLIDEKVAEKNREESELCKEAGITPWPSLAAVETADASAPEAKPTSKA